VARRITVLSLATITIEDALRQAVQAFLELRRDGVRLSELYEVFRHWDPGVTPGLLYRIVRQTLASARFPDYAETPEWLAGTGHLDFGGQTVKRFRRLAPNQRRILDEFQALGWPAQVRNPFLSDRLPIEIAIETFRNATEALNDDHLTPQLLRFGTRDNYTNAYWTLVYQRVPNARGPAPGRSGHARRRTLRPIPTS
jgi:hypothetical protein